MTTYEQLRIKAKPVITRVTELIQESIHEGAESLYWQPLKDQREEFGINGVIAPIIVFKTEEEYQQFLDTGEIPSSLPEGNGFRTAYIDRETTDEFLQLIGFEGDSEEIRDGVTRLIEVADQPWEMPLMVTVIFFQHQNGQDLPSAIFEGAAVDWWDSEADTVPYPNITHDTIRDFLEKQRLAGVTHRVMALNTRNPIHAGPNLNTWLDICEEMQIMPMVAAESVDVLQHLSEENKSKVLAYPLGSAADGQHHS